MLYVLIFVLVFVLFTPMFKLIHYRIINLILPVQVVSEAEVQTNTGPIVTVWVQWTVARVSASLYANSGPEQRKLRAELEDLTTALDLHKVYSKAKVKVTSVSILHFTRRLALFRFV